MSKATFNLRIDSELKARFSQKLRERGESATAVIIRAIKAYCADETLDNNDSTNNNDVKTGNNGLEALIQAQIELYLESHPDRELTAIWDSLDYLGEKIDKLTGEESAIAPSNDDVTTSNDVTPSNDVTMSNDVTLTSNDVTLSNDDVTTSNDVTLSNDDVTTSNDVTPSNDVTMSNDVTLTSNDVTLTSNDVTLTSNDVTMTSNDVTTSNDDEITPTESTLEGTKPASQDETHLNQPEPPQEAKSEDNLSEGVNSKDFLKDSEESAIAATKIEELARDYTLQNLFANNGKQNEIKDRIAILLIESNLKSSDYKIKPNNFTYIKKRSERPHHGDHILAWDLYHKALKLSRG